MTLRGDHNANGTLMVDQACGTTTLASQEYKFG
jgi:hypothetical protein